MQCERMAIGRIDKGRSSLKARMRQHVGRGVGLNISVERQTQPELGLRVLRLPRTGDDVRRAA